PAEGERRLTSAMAPRPGAASTSVKRPIRRPPPSPASTRRAARAARRTRPAGPPPAPRLLPLRERDEVLEPLGGGARVEGLGGDFIPLGEVVRVTAGGDPAARLEGDGAPLG